MCVLYRHTRRGNDFNLAQKKEEEENYKPMIQVQINFEMQGVNQYFVNYRDTNAIQKNGK